MHIHICICKNRMYLCGLYVCMNSVYICIYVRADGPIGFNIAASGKDLLHISFVSNIFSACPSPVISQSYPSAFTKQTSVFIGTTKMLIVKQENIFYRSSSKLIWHFVSMCSRISVETSVYTSFSSSIIKVDNESNILIKIDVKIL